MTEQPRKHVHVACAIIERDGLVLSARRSASMNLPLRWEFPGGKIEPGEGREECLRRELVEEMGVQIDVGRALAPATHHYSTFTVTLYPFVCTIVAGEIILHEHSEIRWLPAHQMHELEWADADVPIIAEYQGQVLAAKSGSASVNP